MNDSGITARWRSWTPQFLSALRIVSAFLFMQYGTAKLFAFPISIMPSGGVVSPWTIVGAAGIIEVFGGALLLLGLFTRPIAFLAAGEMAFAYFKGHASAGFWPFANKGIPAILFCFIWLYISAAGPGPWSLDALRRK